MSETTIIYSGNKANINGESFTINAKLLKSWGFPQDAISAGLTAKLSWQDIIEGVRKANLWDYPQLRKQNGVAMPQIPAVSAPPAAIPAAAAPQTTTLDAMAAELARLRAENEQLKKQPVPLNQLTLKVSEKRALSIYGLSRYPFTLYKRQWRRLLAMKPEIEAFIAAHDSQLADEKKD